MAVVVAGVVVVVVVVVTALLCPPSVDVGEAGLAFGAASEEEVGAGSWGMLLFGSARTTSIRQLQHTTRPCRERASGMLQSLRGHVSATVEL